MLGNLFPKGFKKFLSLPLFGPVAEEWADWLEEQGYTWSTRRLMFRTLGRIDRYCRSAVDSLDHLSWSDLVDCHDAFHRSRPSEAGTVRTLGRFLESRGLVRADPPTGSTRTDRLLFDYVDHLRQVRGFAGSTIRSHSRTVREFLGSVDYENHPERLASLSIDQIEAFVGTTGQRVSRASLQHVVAALRGWLRFLAVREILRPGLELRIDTPRCYRLERLPRSIPWETVLAFLRSIDQGSQMGSRDYTIFYLMATYGLRNSEVAGLTLDDIDWRCRILRIGQRKASAVLTLPLTDDAGSALHRYLGKARPPTLDRHVFLRVRAPSGPLKPTAVVEAFQRWSRRSGLSIPFQGPHCLRHSYAVHLLESGVSLKSIGDLLGHRHAESTGVYLRVSIEDLRQVALAVPRAGREVPS